MHKPMIEGLSHITFIVRDLDRMEEILVSVLGARKVYDSGDSTFSVSRERFFLAGEEPAPVWLAIMEGESLPTRTYNHIAFKISEADYPVCLERVQALGLLDPAEVPLDQGAELQEGDGQGGPGLQDQLVADVGLDAQGQDGHRQPQRHQVAGRRRKRTRRAGEGGLLLDPGNPAYGQCFRRADRIWRERGQFRVRRLSRQ